MLQPCLLSCLHFICVPCIKSSDSETTTCAVCNDVSENNKANPDEKTKILLDYLSNCQAKKQHISNLKKCCAVCKLLSGADVIADFICKECSELLCSACEEKHCYSKFTFNHRPSIVELSEPVFEELKDTLRKEPITVCCEKHIGKQLNYFCKVCQVLICGDCIVSQHKEHRFLPLKCAEPESRRDFISLLSKAKLEQDKLHQKHLKNQEFVENQKTKKNELIENLQKHWMLEKAKIDKQFHDALAFLEEELTKLDSNNKEQSTQLVSTMNSLERDRKQTDLLLSQHNGEVYLAMADIYRTRIETRLAECTQLVTKPLNIGHVQINPKFDASKTPLFIQHSFYNRTEGLLSLTKDSSGNLKEKEEIQKKSGTKVANTMKMEVVQISNLLDSLKSDTSAINAKTTDNHSHSLENDDVSSKRKKRKRNKNSEGGAPNAAEAVTSDAMVSAGGEKVGRFCKMSKNNETTPLQAVQMASGDKPVKGPLVLTPKWRMDVWIDTDTVKPNVTAVLGFGSKVAVADANNNKVKIFSTDGQFLKEYAFLQPTSLAMCGGSRIICSSNENNKYICLNMASNKATHEYEFDLLKCPHPVGSSSGTFIVGNGKSAVKYNWQKSEKRWTPEGHITPIIDPINSNDQHVPQQIMSLAATNFGGPMAMSDWQNALVSIMDKDGLVTG